MIFESTTLSANFKQPLKPFKPFKPIKPSPTHITVIAPYKVFPAKAGGQKNIASFYDHLGKLVPITVISTRNNEIPVGYSFEFLPILSNSALRYINIFLFFRIKKIVAEKKSTHLFIEHPYYGWLGILLKWFCGVKLVVRSHNIEATRFKSMGKWWWGILWNYEKIVHRNAHLNFFITGEDRQFAIDKYRLKAVNSHVITYGIDMNQAPTQQEKNACREQLLQIHRIDKSARILFFNGMLDYHPNIDAVNKIIENINPVLVGSKQFEYKIIICGKNLPVQYDGLKKNASSNIIYAGFVDDLSVYYKGVDLFINPVTDGGGIKTKLVEALGYDLYCITTAIGAYGVPALLTGNRLKIVQGENWNDFANAIIQSDHNTGKAGILFYEHFNWVNIAKKAMKLIH